MALYFSMRDLKSIRNVYSELGILNSPTLEQIKSAIALSHFLEADITEIKETLTQYEILITQTNQPIEPEISAAKSKAIMIGEILNRSKASKLIESRKFEKV